MSSHWPYDNYHLLMWYASYSVTIAEDCEDGRTKRILKALAVDLTLEASRLLRERRAREDKINELRATCGQAPGLREPPDKQLSLSANPRRGGSGNSLWDWL
jgi:hypothetical protein